MADIAVKSKPIKFTISRDVKMVGSDIGSGLWLASDSAGRGFFMDVSGVGVVCDKNKKDEDSYSFYLNPLSSSNSPRISEEDAAQLNAILREGIAKAEFVNKTPQDVLAAVDAIADNNDPLTNASFEVRTVSPLEIACKSPRLKALEPKGNKHFKSN